MRRLEYWLFSAVHLLFLFRKGKVRRMPQEEVEQAKDEDVWNMVVMLRAFARK
jgi:hypothetical protein